MFRFRTILRFIWGAFAWVVALGCAAWAFGALYYDLPAGKMGVEVVALFLLGLVAVRVFVRAPAKRMVVIFAGFVVVLVWWLTLKPRNDRPWQPDVAETAWAEIKEDEITLHNVRNCDYRSESDYTPRWETRTVRLSQVTGIDLAINYWGSPWMAHPIVSFQFADALPVCFSIETRKEIGESYSAIGGLYRQYELIYLVADERDVIRVRTNYRHGEEAYLYRLNVTPAQARERFLEYIHTLNALHEKPRWYNAVTTNCTTNIRAQHPAGERLPWDWRILLNGKGDEMMFERHVLATAGLPFAELKRQALINSAAQSADAAADFSRQIRKGRAGFETADVPGTKLP
jgi:hypothetical protein